MIRGGAVGAVQRSVSLLDVDLTSAISLPLAWFGLAETWIKKKRHVTQKTHTILGCKRYDIYHGIKDSAAM